MTAPTITLPEPPALSPPSTSPARGGRSRALGAVAIVVALVAVAYGCFVVVNLLGLRTYRTTSSYPAATDLELRGGDEKVTLVPDAGDRIIVERTVRRDLRPAKTTTKYSHGTLIVGGGCSAGLHVFCSASVTIHVPHHIDVRGHLSDGSFSASGLAGSVHLSTGDGSVHLDRLTGPLWLHAGDGSVHVQRLSGPTVDIATGDGSVHVGLTTAPSSISVETGDGSVDVCLPRGAPAYAIATHTGDGGVDNQLPNDPRADRSMRVSTGDGHVSLHLCETAG